MSDDLVKRLQTVSGMISLGERISWGQDTALMDEAAAEITRLTKWRAEEGEKIKRQAKALTELKAHCERVEAERDGLARKVAEVQRSGDDLAHSELADLQARVHNQRQEIARLRTQDSRADLIAEITRLRAKVDAAAKMAEKADDCVERFVEAFPAAADYPPIVEFRAALSAYEEAGK
jgi:chromosome segregation ATPase